MTPAQRAAANLDYITYLDGDDAGNRAKRVRVIEAAYAERDSAVAELVASVKAVLKCSATKCCACRIELQATIAALEGK